MEETILTCQSITKRFGSIVAVNDLDLELRHHEFLAILGPSGCGKSTALRMIAGFESTDSGRITLQNKQVSGPNCLVPPQQRNLGMVFQDLALFPHLSVAQNIMFGLNGSKETKQKRLKQMLELIGLQDSAAKMPHMISGGEQQRVAIARALAPSPELILLDEPFSSLDYQLRVQLRKDIRNMLRKEQVSAILVTHDQEEAFIFADQMIVIHQGRVMQKGTPSEIYHEPANPWVAAFVGEANFLPYAFGKNFLMPETPLINQVQSVEEATSQLMVRPEDISVERSNSSNADGLIRYIDFSGDQQILKIKLFPDTLIQARVSSRQLWNAEDYIQVRFHHCTLFPMKSEDA